jgi:hypothetical protein
MGTCLHISTSNIKLYFLTCIVQKFTFVHSCQRNAQLFILLGPRNGGRGELPVVGAGEYPARYVARIRLFTG